jgi:hypothetical protein
MQGCWTMINVITSEGRLLRLLFDIRISLIFTPLYPFRWKALFQFTVCEVRTHCFTYAHFQAQTEFPFLDKGTDQVMPAALTDTRSAQTEPELTP